MGLFDFMKDAGRKMPDVPPQAQRRDISPAELEALKRKKGLEKVVAELGVEIEGLAIEVQGDTAIVTGKVDSQAEREKVVLAVGNVAGIARVDDRLTAAKKEPESTFYTVKSGDTLSKIAKAQYGNASLYPKIFEANRPMLADPNKIYPGQVLRIPPAA